MVGWLPKLWSSVEQELMISRTENSAPIEQFNSGTKVAINELFQWSRQALMGHGHTYYLLGPDPDRITEIRCFSFLVKVINLLFFFSKREYTQWDPRICCEFILIGEFSRNVSSKVFVVTSFYSNLQKIV